MSDNSAIAWGVVLVVVAVLAVWLGMAEQSRAEAWCRAHGYPKTTYIHRTGTFCVDDAGRLIAVP